MQTEAAAPPQGTKDKSTPHLLPSGATLHLHRPSYKAASRLRNALANGLGSVALSGEEMKAGLAEIKADSSKGGALVSRVLKLVASEEVEAALFACLWESSYQPSGTPARVKIDHDLLDHDKFGDEARNDLYPMFYRAGEVAIKPFLQPLVSAFTEFQKKTGASPASPSASAKSAS